MKAWIIASILLGVLVIGGFAVVSAISNSNNVNTNTAETQTATGSPTCTGCGGACTVQSNCERATCEAVSGTGTCGCGK
ncbi:MAG: hypothetical protein NTZ83_02955 [Candidatus Pacearchaeota archaeon]|nr:hypothetical protein [Candidatus Pacearchaeota archaeon]